MLIIMNIGYRLSNVFLLTIYLSTNKMCKNAVSFTEFIVNYNTYIMKVTLTGAFLEGAFVEK